MRLKGYDNRIESPSYVVSIGTGYQFNDWGTILQLKLKKEYVTIDSTEHEQLPSLIIKLFFLVMLIDFLRMWGAMLCRVQVKNPQQR